MKPTSTRVAQGAALLIAILTCTYVDSLRAQGSGQDWLSYNGSSAGDRFSSLTEITRSNVASLQEVCTFDSGEHLSFQTGPVVVNGTIYVTTDTATYALDATNCAVKWHNSHSYSPVSYLANNHGAAFHDGRLFRTSNDVHAYSIDATTGKTLWDVAIGNPKIGESAPMAPLTWQGMVFVGTAGGDNFGVTGRLYALSASDGHVLWEFKTVPDKGAARRTWTKESKDNPPTGGGIWTSVSLDESAGILYAAAGNPAPDFALALHPGASLYTNSILALDARTGRLLGYIQLTKGDYHDWDISATPAIITTRGGRKLLAIAGKGGLFYAVRPKTTDQSSRKSVLMSVLYQTPTTTRSNISAALSSAKLTHFCPGTQGGTEWNGPSYSSALNTAFVGAVDWCASVRLQGLDTLKGAVGMPWTGMDGPPQMAFGLTDPTSTWGGWITALNADNGAVKWKFHSSAPILAGLVSTAADLVFSGDVNGDVFALDARTGRELWRAPTRNAIGGGVVTYAAGGHQYIAVAAGMKSPIWPVPVQSARVVIYGLH